MFFCNGAFSTITILFNVNPFQPLQIKSAVAVEGLKGYIYIEAFKQQHVKQAIEDIGNLRLGRWQQQMVPIREMTDVMRVVKDTSGVKRGSWVRIKRGIFKDDVAQVSTYLVTVTWPLWRVVASRLPGGGGGGGGGGARTLQGAPLAVSSTQCILLY